MTSLLHLDASPAAQSVSRELTALFAETWRARHGSAGYRYRDLAAEPVPLVGPAFCTLGQRSERVGGPVAPEGADEEREWSLTLPLISEVLAADTVLIGVPMYNFSIPAALKAWIDRVTFPNVYLDPDTGDKLLRGTKVVVVTARGGAYGPGTQRESYDFQEPYLRVYFGELGVSKEDLSFVHAEFTRAADVPALARFQDLAASSLEAARKEVRTLGALA